LSNTSFKKDDKKIHLDCPDIFILEYNNSHSRGFNMRIKSIFFVFLLIAATLPSFAQEKKDFERIVDFSINLERLDRFYQRNPADAVPTEKILVLDGAISSIEVLNEEPESFLAELTIVGGKWRDTTEVRMFSCIVQIEGPAFAERIPARRSRREPRNVIKPNLHVILVGKIVDVRTDKEGNAVPVLDGYYIRTTN